jgi:hypothetical protein
MMKEVDAIVVATIMIWHVGQPYIAQEVGDAYALMGMLRMHS